MAVLGSSTPRPNEEAYALAYEIGFKLGRSGFDVINGGYDGVMTASSEGARDAGAMAIGVTCGEIQDRRNVEPNEFLHEVIEVPVLVRRLELLMKLAGGYAILPGGTGTIAELGIVWEHINKSFIAPRPIVCVGAVWQPIIDFVVANQEDARVTIEVVNTADEAVAIMQERAIDADLDAYRLIDECGAQVRASHA